MSKRKKRQPQQQDSYPDRYIALATAIAAFCREDDISSSSFEDYIILNTKAINTGEGDLPAYQEYQIACEVSI